MSFWKVTPKAFPSGVHGEVGTTTELAAGVGKAATD